MQESPALTRREGPGLPEPDRGDERSPYQGLGFYTEADTRWFFGRDTDRKRVISNLRTSRLTVLYAESGVGKSSLLRAGVAARLTQLAEDSLAHRGTARFVPVVFSDWRDEPLGPLVAAIERQTARFRLPATVDEITRQVLVVTGEPAQAEGSENGDSTHGLDESELARAIADAAAVTNATLLIILDQFEEHFRYRPNQSSPDRLADEISACVNAPGLPVRFLIAVREDGYGTLGDLFRGRIGNVYKNYIHLGYLSREAARQAIEGPVGRYNEEHPDDPPINIEPGLTDAVLTEVRRGNLVLGPGPDQAGPTEVTPVASEDEIEAPFLQLVMERLWARERADHSPLLRRKTLDVTLGGAERIVRDHLSDALSGLDSEQLTTAERLFRELVTPSGTKIAHTTADLVDLAERPEESVTAVLEQLDVNRIVRAVDPAPGSTVGRYEVFHDKLAEAILDWLSLRRTDQLREERKKAEDETREQKARARRFKALAIALGVLIAFAVVVIVYAFSQKHAASVAKAKATREKVEAERQATNAAYWALTTRAQSQMSSRPDLALLLFLAAYRESPQSLAERSLVATLQAVEMSGASGILHGHTDAIEGVAFDPRAPMLASASGDGSIRLWHVDQGQRYPVSLLRTGGPVLSVAFSPDGRRLVSGSFNKLIVWNVATATRLRVTHPGGAVTSVAFSPDGDWLAAGNLNGTVSLLNVHTGRTKVLATTPAKPVRDVAFNRTSDLLAAGELGGRVVLWNVAQGREARVLDTYRNDVYAVAFSPTADLLAAGGASRQIGLWNLSRNDRTQAALTGPPGFIYSLAFDPRGDALAAGGTSDVELWNPLTGRQIAAPLTGERGAVYGVAFSPDGHTLASAGADRTIRTWAFPPIRRYGVPLSLSQGRPVLSVAVARNGLIASGATNGSIYVTRGPDAAPVEIASPRGLHSIAFAQGGRVLASAGNDGAIHLWNPTTGKSLGERRAVGPTAKLLALASDPNGTTLVSGDGAGNVRVWSTTTSKQIGPALTGDTGAVFAVAFNPATREIAAAGNGRTIRVWHAAGDGWAAWPAIGQDDALFALAFSPDGHTLASGAADGTIRLWKLAPSPSATAKTLVADANFIRGLAFSPDGRTLASAGADLAVRLWDLTSDTELGEPLSGDTGTVESVAFTPDGRFLVSGSDDHTVRIWRAAALPGSFAALTRQVCAFLGAGLNAAEKHQYAPGIVFQQPCSRVTPG